MGKKKLSLKPVQRGFATTSVPTKKAKEEAAALKAEKEAALQAENEATASTAHDKGAPDGLSDVPPTDSGTTNDTKEAWDSDAAVEAAVYQGLIERLQDKGDKDVSRILKSIEFDSRFAATFPTLDINERIRECVLKTAVRESEGGSLKSLPPVSGSADEDKALLRLYTTYQVLRSLGFSEDRVAQCIREGLGDGEGWAEGVEWMWLHLSEDECRQVGEFAKPAEEPLVDEPLLETVPSAIESPSTPASASPAVPTPPVVPTPPSVPISSTGSSSLFQSLGASDDSESEPESDEDPDITLVNQNWAALTLELDTMRMLAGASQGKPKGGKKGKQSRVVMETPEMVKVKGKIAKLEKDYMFSRKEADLIFKSLKAKRDMDALEAKLKGASVSSAKVSAVTSAAATPNVDSPTPTEPETTTTAPSNAESDEEEGGLFGNMLDEPEPNTEPATGNTTITVREMPIPKQFSFTNNTPKALLQSSLSKSSKQVVSSFVKLSSNPRVARSGLEIRWSADNRRRVWKMVDLACSSFEESDSYVATLALNELSASGDLTGVNWRAMPPAYRDLWDELEAARKEKVNAEQRDMWKKVKQLYDEKTKVAQPSSEQPTQATPTPVATSNRTGSAKKVTSEELQSAYEKRVASSSYQKMRRDRDTLPIAPFRQEIVDALEKSQVLVFSGETGCGKSTQLPAFILEDQLAKGKPCKIFVTEPRRISAISLAQRVSVELGDAPGVMGTNDSLVGYSVRLESKISANTRLAFVTNGIALRMLESGSGAGNKGTAFDEVTHIIVDEVHERSIESDFLLIILKELIVARPDLKVILMSATVDAEKISAFFGGCPFMSVPGRTFPVNVNYLEDAVETAGWHIDETSPYAVSARYAKAGAKQLEWTEENAREDGDDGSGDEDKPSDPSKLSAVRYSARTAETVNLLDSRKIPYDLIVRLLERMCFEDAELGRFSAATLVFMPGLAEIRKLNDMLQSHPQFGAGDFVVYPLHSSISSEGQSAVFQIPPPGVRKIVISTNIAETGVTIPDITCVIDTGRQKEMRYDEKRQLSRLVDVYIARSNAKQRRGRAGRVQEGLAFHLFTKARHDSQLAEHPIPEMLRLSLQDLALRIKILKVKLGNTVEEVLLRALDPPSSTNIQRAVASLVEVKALTANEEITAMGRLLSKLPTDVHLGKFLLNATLFKCLDPALTIAAALSSKTPFITPFGFEAQADAAKKSFATGNSDFLTIVNAFDSWRRASENANFVRTFCKRNYLSHQNLQQIEELRQQLLSYLIDANFVPSTPELKQEIAKARSGRGFRTRFVTVPAETNTNANEENVLGAALASGLYPKILTLDRSGGMTTISNQQPVAIHPSSINFRIPKGEFGTDHLVYFNLMQSRKLYAWEVGPVQDRALALVCGDALDVKVSASSVQLDRKIRYRADPKTALAIKLLREQFHAAVAAKMRGRTLSPRQEEWFNLGLRYIATGKLDESTLVVA